MSLPIRTSVASTCATTMELAWLDLRTRDTNVCVHLVTRENSVKKARVILHLRSDIRLTTIIMRLFSVYLTLVSYASTCLPMTN